MIDAAARSDPDAPPFTSAEDWERRDRNRLAQIPWAIRYRGRSYFRSEGQRRVRNLPDAAGSVEHPLHLTSGTSRRFSASARKPCAANCCDSLAAIGADAGSAMEDTGTPGHVSARTRKRSAMARHGTGWLSATPCTCSWASASTSAPSSTTTRLYGSSGTGQRRHPAHVARLQLQQYVCSFVGPSGFPW